MEEIEWFTEVIVTIGRLPIFMGALIFLALTSCSPTRTQRIGLPESSRAPRSAVAMMQDQVETELRQHVRVTHAAVVTTLASPWMFPENIEPTALQEKFDGYTPSSRSQGVSPYNRGLTQKRSVKSSERCGPQG